VARRGRRANEVRRSGPRACNIDQLAESRAHRPQPVLVWPSARYHRISACHRDLNFKSANAVFLPRPCRGRLSPCYRASLPPALNFKFPARPPCRIAAATSDFRVFPPAYALSFVSLPGPTLFQGTRSVAAFIYGGRVPGIDSVIYLAAPIRAIPRFRVRRSASISFACERTIALSFLASGTRGSARKQRACRASTPTDPPPAKVFRRFLRAGLCAPNCTPPREDRESSPRQQESPPASDGGWVTGVGRRGGHERRLIEAQLTALKRQLLIRRPLRGDLLIYAHT